MKIFSIVAFALIMLAQWFVPASIILKKEKIISKGKLFKFKTEPIDPSDPFEGKYITLNYHQNSFALTPALSGVSSGDEVFVVLKIDSGFVKISDVVITQPKNNIDYVKAKVGYINTYNEDKKIDLIYSFNKFFMQEFKAPKAENLYRDANRKPEDNCYAVISIYEGSAVINDVMINEISISKLVK